MLTAQQAYWLVKKGANVADVSKVITPKRRRFADALTERTAAMVRRYPSPTKRQPRDGD